ncbi:MAG: alpha/beta fold hydrolase, partial [Lysinibacillus sp.]
MEFVFIHGLGQNASSWNQTVSYLAKHRHVNCPDLSAMLHEKEATYNNLYNSFIKYCEQIDQPLHLCGLSLGGNLALNYAIDYPEKVESLVLLGTQYNMPKLLLKLQNSIFRFLPKATFHELGFKKSDFIQLTNSMLHLNFTSNLIDISCATLIVCGEKDYPNKNASKALVKRIPKAELQLIPNAGHELNTQAPQKLAQTLETFY